MHTSFDHGMMLRRSEIVVAKRSEVEVRLVNGS